MAAAGPSAPALPAAAAPPPEPQPGPPAGGPVVAPPGATAGSDDSEDEVVLTRPVLGGPVEPVEGTDEPLGQEGPSGPSAGPGREAAEAPAPPALAPAVPPGEEPPLRPPPAADPEGAAEPVAGPAAAPAGAGAEPAHRGVDEEEEGEAAGLHRGADAAAPELDGEGGDHGHTGRRRPPQTWLGALAGAADLVLRPLGDIAFGVRKAGAESKEEEPAAPLPPVEVRYGPYWWDRYFTLQYGHDLTVLLVRLRGAGIGDDDVRPMTLALDAFLRRSADPALPLSMEVDVSENGLSDTGGVQLLRWLRWLISHREAGARLRILKLFRNSIGDAACEQLAKLIGAQGEPIEEIHLSHNQIQQRGLAAVLISLARHPKGAYPRQTSTGPCPCWVRLEHNQVADVPGLLDALAKEPVRLRVCLAPRSRVGASCTSYACSVRSHSYDDVAHVHLYCVHEQSATGTGSSQAPAKLIRQYMASATEGWLNMGADAEPDGGDSRARVVVPQELPQDLQQGRLVTLRVEKDHGAGLELQADAYGFAVQAVEDVPGQDVQPGEVILEIDSVPLWGNLDEDSLDAAFGSRFGPGACLRVAPLATVQGRPLWQPIGLTGSTLGSRCAALRSAFRDDLAILGNRCGAKVELSAEEGALLIRGPPAAQRWALEELSSLTAFYFPERAPRAAVPSNGWRGDRDPLCDPDESHRQPATGSQELNVWESALRQQHKEDDDIDDDELPWEPLEAPDEGPEVFEGENVLPAYDLDRPLRMLVLVGLPGSGKSTVSKRFGARGWMVVNQDTMGDRRACVRAARDALQSGRRVVVDRCNVSRVQRRVWLAIADEFEAGVACLWLDIDPAECGARVLRRFNHPTLPADSSSLQVINSFAEGLERPMEAEGLMLWRARGDDELEGSVNDIFEVAEWSETKATAAAPPVAKPPAAGLGAATAVAAARKPAEQGFKYNDTRTRGARCMHLRAVRRQIEYYFSDGNLRQDWFLQEKMASEPEPGWLELRWLLSCPRVRDVHKASAEDVLEALQCSPLMVKQAEGTHWVRRGRPPPALSEPRPAAGREPDWYKSLHDHGPASEEPAAEPVPEAEEQAQQERAAGGASPSAPEAPPPALPAAKSPAAEPEPTSDDAAAPLGDVIRCAACGRDRAKELFSKAQLTKHRRSPTCKDCVAA